MPSKTIIFPVYPGHKDAMQHCRIYQLLHTKLDILVWRSVIHTEKKSSIARGGAKNYQNCPHLEKYPLSRSQQLLSREHPQGLPPENHHQQGRIRDLQQ